MRDRWEATWPPRRQRGPRAGTESSEAPTSPSADSVPINTASREPDTAVAKYFSTGGKKGDATHKTTITCTSGTTWEQDDVEFRTNPYENKTARTFKLTVVMIK